MTRPDAELDRVSQRIAEMVLQFCKTPRGIFHLEELETYVATAMGEENVTPGSPGRILRDLRGKGQLNYRVLSRSDSLYSMVAGTYVPPRGMLAADTWKTNADIILDLAELGYLKTTDLVLDPTYGKGNWWKQWRPTDLVTNTNQWDFRDCPYPDEMFDVVAYDPPYVAKGGRETSGIRDMDDAYGLYDCPATPALLQELIDAGLTEMHRVVKVGGVVLVKCQNYVSSGKLWLGAYWTLQHALRLEFKVEEVLTHVGNPGPQPPDRRQVHARNNASTMYVLRKVKPPKPVERVVPDRDDDSEWFKKRGG